MKRLHHTSSGKYKLKQDTTTHLLECLKSRTRTTPNAHEDMKLQKLSFVSGGNAKCHGQFANSLAVSYKIKYTFTV